MLFTLPQKLFLFSRYLSFCLNFLVMYRKGLIKKIKFNFKCYDVTAWLIKNCNTHMPNISRCLILFLIFTCNNFPFRAIVTKIYWTSTEVLVNLVAPLVSAVYSLDFEQINVFWTSGFDSVSILKGGSKSSKMSAIGWLTKKILGYRTTKTLNFGPFSIRFQII